MIDDLIYEQLKCNHILPSPYKCYFSKELELKGNYLVVINNVIKNPLEDTLTPAFKIIKDGERFICTQLNNFKPGDTRKWIGPIDFVVRMLVRHYEFKTSEL